MREFVSLFVSPLTVLSLLLIFTIVFRLLKRNKTSVVFLFLSVIWLLAVSTRPLPRVIVSSLEKRYSQLNPDDIKTIPDSVNIIVLGAGYSDEAYLSPNNQLNHHALMRLAEGIRLQKQIPGSRLITSGMGYRTGLVGAVVMYRTALILGMDSASMDISGIPLTTWSEADQYLKKFGNEKKVVLVTSAVHMPRAVMLFRSKGIDVIPAPADFLVRHPAVKNPRMQLPNASNVRMLEQAIHEYGGIVWHKVGGR